MPTPLPPLPHAPSLGDFARGLLLPFRALRLVFGERKLFWLSALSALVTLAALAAVFWAGFRWADDLVSLAFARPDAWALRALWYLIVALAFGTIVVVGANTLPVLLLAPLQDPISEATEELCGDFTAPPFSVGRALRGTYVALGHTLARIFFLVAGHAALFPLHFIPGVGSVAWGVVSTVWTMAWIAGEYLDGPMARHLYRFREVRQVLWERKALALGFGAAVYAMLWVPILNLFFIPTAVVAGTLLFRGLRAAGNLRPPG